MKYLNNLKSKNLPFYYVDLDPSKVEELKNLVKSVTVPKAECQQCVELCKSALERKMKKEGKDMPTAEELKIYLAGLTFEMCQSPKVAANIKLCMKCLKAKQDATDALHDYKDLMKANRGKIKKSQTENPSMTHL